MRSQADCSCSYWIALLCFMWSVPSPESYQMPETPENKTAALTKDLRIKAKVFYDVPAQQMLKTIARDPTATAEATISEIIRMVNQIFNWKGLGVAVTVEMVGEPLLDLEGRWAATVDSDNHQSDPTFTRHLTQESIHHHIFLGSDQTDGDVKSGFSFEGTVCDSAPEVKYSIIEVGDRGPHSLEIVAMFLAHEIAHAMGIKHDFEGREKTELEACSKAMGVMGRSPSRAVKWSECSRRDLVKYYETTVKRDGAFCLE